MAWISLPRTCILAVKVWRQEVGRRWAATTWAGPSLGTPVDGRSACLPVTSRGAGPDAQERSSPSPSFYWEGAKLGGSLWSGVRTVKCLPSRLWLLKIRDEKSKKMFKGKFLFLYPFREGHISFVVLSSLQHCLSGKLQFLIFSGTLSWGPNTLNQTLQEMMCLLNSQHL